jgi:hypothetical protein
MVTLSGNTRRKRAAAVKFPYGAAISNKIGPGPAPSAESEESLAGFILLLHRTSKNRMLSASQGRA